MATTGAHILVFPYPAQGHMIPLLDLTNQLAIRGVIITILVTPKNLTYLKPLLSAHPSRIKTLVFHFPINSFIPAGIENVKDLPPNGFRVMMQVLGQLQDPLFQWFKDHPTPPVAIISDMFLGWTHDLACRLGIRRFMFSPSGTMANSFIDSLWRFLPTKKDPTDDNEIISLPHIPNSPSYPWWQLSTVYRSYVRGEPVSEFIKAGYISNIKSWGFVINSFNELESVYVDYLKKQLGHDRIWTVGPLLPPADASSERGGSSTVLANDILSWLDACGDKTVVYICFGSQAVLTNLQMEALASGLEKSGARFLWSVKEPTVGHVAENYGKVPLGFEERVAGRGLVIRGWVPQVMILQHRAVVACLNHCGWNTVLEALVAGVPILAWPMGADQYLNATLLVDELKMGVRVSEGPQSVPDSSELGRLVAEAVDKNQAAKKRAVELRDAALRAINGGSSSKNLDELVDHFSVMLAK